MQEKVLAEIGTLISKYGLEPVHAPGSFSNVGKVVGMDGLQEVAAVHYQFSEGLPYIFRAQVDGQWLLRQPDRPDYHDWLFDRRSPTAPTLIRFMKMLEKALSECRAEAMAEFTRAAPDMGSAEALEVALHELDRCILNTDTASPHGHSLRQAHRVLDMIAAQRGCEHFDPAVTDGKLTHLIDVIVFG
jgi:hypothetical protein